MKHETNPPEFKTISGRWVVIGMLAFGSLATGTLWVYTKLDLAPFLPLRKAIQDEFPKSHPDVRGGRSKRSPPVLRIVMQVESTPHENDPEVTKIVERVIALSKAHIDLRDYENFELYLVRYVPEKTPERIKVERKISEL